MIRYFDLPAENRSVADELLRALSTVIDHGCIVLGSEVGYFEEQVAALHARPCGPSPWAVGVSNGTDALALALEVLDVGPGDEVVTVPNTFVATVAAVVRRGAKPVFVDVDEHQLLDAAALEGVIGVHTKAIVPVHLHGRPADMTQINAIASAAGIAVVEDAAQALGARWDGRPTGTLGALGCYSMHPLKTLGALGDAGVIVGVEHTHQDALRRLRNHGLSDRNTCEIWGHNARLDTLQAAMLVVKLDRLKGWNDRRREIASSYLSELAGLPLELPILRQREEPVWSGFVVETDNRDDLRASLADNGVETLIYYPVPLHLQPSARALGYGPGDFPIAERHAKRMLSLPVHPFLTDSDVAHVVASVRGFFRA